MPVLTVRKTTHLLFLFCYSFHGLLSTFTKFRILKSVSEGYTYQYNKIGLIIPRVQTINKKDFLMNTCLFL